MKTPKQITDEIRSNNFMLDSMQFHAEYNVYIYMLSFFNGMLDEIDKDPYKEYKIKGIEKAIRFMVEDGA
jgi:hypothetical protein